ncbi:VCBS repeat-containing protein [Neolewinella persica]|uniref:VCBS repeat-containing protein n=1 Tax=Neolewinella persica TaxID=70998 RepID=UPI00146C7874|nr:VCBS repeat-containing protein [Neolewinella persica]
MHKVHDLEARQNAKQYLRAILDMQSRLTQVTVAILLLLCTACTEDSFIDTPACQADETKPFTQMACDPATGITFNNALHYTEALNPYTYRNFYNGGGVGIADFNGDGLADVFFSGNLVDNQLYLNQGDWRFEDVTERAGVACPGSWSTGVAIMDIDADGDQDIYVCKAGPPAGEEIPGMDGVRHNELFLNNGDATFREAAKEFGLDVVGLSVHAAFFDYDQDGDLDAYLLNNSTRSTTGYNAKAGLREIPDPTGGNKLLRNDGGTFTDVTAEANIYSSAIGFGLGVTVGDVNEDGLPDLFVSNDYFERDYLYFNQGDGTFKEQLTDYLPEISKGSMGADFADLTGDGLPELFVTEMLPRTEKRRKTKAAFDDWNRYQLYRDEGYHQQFSRNVLQHNLGGGRFSEVGRMAGVAATDWSWGALLFDMDNDGRRDIFVANGVGKDLLDQDYINFDANQASIRQMINEEGKTITDIIDLIPSEALVNGVFRNDGALSFTDVSGEWGFEQKTFSNGSAYGDLDNDGDLDLVVNNIDGLAGVYRNNTTLPGLTLHLRARQKNNPDGIGSQLFARQDDRFTYAELHPMRGFESTVDKRLNVAGSPDSVLVRWPDGNWETFTSLPTKGLATLTQGAGQARTQGAKNGFLSKVAGSPRISQRELPALTHQEDRFSDFDRDPLLFWGLSNEGPALAFDRHQRLGYLGGSVGQPGKLLSGTTVIRELTGDKEGENVDAIWFDANGDGIDDLYVVNGSNQFSASSTALLDKLYFGTRSGNLQPSDQLLPLSNKLVAGSCARSYDVDGDGDQDLFVGGRLRPGLYGVPADSYLLLNDGKGNFSDARIPDLQRLGLVTDAIWAETDGDPEPELVVAREWGAVSVLHWKDGEVVEVEILPLKNGLWHKLAVADLNGDGKEDIVAGNYGTNTSLRASDEVPIELHVNDFDGNGRAEQLITQGDVFDGRSRPINLRNDLVKQMPALRKSVQRYSDYADKTLEDLFSPKVLARSEIGSVHMLISAVALSGPDGWTVAPLPAEAQRAPIYALCIADLNGDGHPDIITGGNQTVAKPEFGTNAAGFGNILINDGAGHFSAFGPAATGMVLSGDVRAIVPKSKHSFLVARSNGAAIELTIEQ